MPLVAHSGYRPMKRLPGGHLQTIFPSLLRKVATPTPQRERLDTPDHDFIDADWYRHKGPRTAARPLVMVMHGLEGNSRKPYVQGMVTAFFNLGWDALAWNFRSCSGTMNRQLRFYHCGDTPELAFMVNYALAQGYGTVVLVGFSMGGNLVLRYLGEKGPQVPKEVIAGAALSVPVNVEDSVRKLHRPGNYLYHRRFLRDLKRKVRQKALIMPEHINTAPLRRIRTLTQLDDYFTGPIHGFENGVDYYRKTASLDVLPQITVPSLIINAQNDPFLSASCYPYALLDTHPHVWLETPAQGGHCGFAGPGLNGLFWSDRRVAAWASALQRGQTPAQAAATSAQKYMPVPLGID